MGNGRAHDFLYDLLSRVPGLLVLHDLVLHHARAAQFLESEAVRAWREEPSSAAAREAARAPLDAWRAELEYSYPGRGERLFEAHLGTVGDLLPYAYPLFRVPVEASRAVAVHNAFTAEAVRSELPGTEVMCVPMPAAAAPVDPTAVRALRARLGWGADEVVVGVFGLLTREKQVETVARAVARAAARDPPASAAPRGPGAGPRPARGRPRPDRRAPPHGRDRPRAALRSRHPHRGGGRRGPPALPHRARDLGRAPARARAGPRDRRVRPRAPGRPAARTPWSGWTSRTKRAS